MSKDVTLEKMKLTSLIDDWYVRDRRVQRYGFLNLKSFTSQQQTQYHRALKALKTALTLATISYQDKRVLHKAWVIGSRDIFETVSANRNYNNLVLKQIIEINSKIQRQKEYVSPQTLEKVGTFTEKCLKSMIHGKEISKPTNAIDVVKKTSTQARIGTPPVIIDITGASRQGQPSPSIIHAQLPHKADKQLAVNTSKQIKVSVKNTNQSHDNQYDHKRTTSHIAIKEAFKLFHAAFYNFVSHLESEQTYIQLSIVDRIEVLGKCHSITNHFQADLESYDDITISASRLHGLIRKFQFRLGEVLEKVVRDSATKDNIEHRLMDRVSLFFRQDYRSFFKYPYQQALFEGILHIQLSHMKDSIRDRFGYINTSEYQYQVSVKFTRKYVESLAEKIESFRPIHYDATSFNPNPVRFEQVKEYVFQLMQKHNTSGLGYAQMSLYTSRIDSWMSVLKNALDQSPHPSVSIQLANWFTKSSKNWIAASYSEAFKLNLKRTLSPLDNHISLLQVEESFVKVYAHLVGSGRNRILHEDPEFKGEIVDLQHVLLEEVRSIAVRGRVNLYTYHLFSQVVFPQYINHVIDTFY